jgi:hypothetical protein
MTAQPPNCFFSLIVLSFNIYITFQRFLYFTAFLCLGQNKINPLLIIFFFFYSFLLFLWRQNVKTCSKRRFRFWLFFTWATWASKKNTLVTCIRNIATAAQIGTWASFFSLGRLGRIFYLIFLCIFLCNIFLIL